MKYINLDPIHNPYKAKRNQLIDNKIITFAGGEPHVKILETLPPGDVTVTTKLKSGNDLIKLMCVTDALKRAGRVDDMYLYCAYLPGARQDRLMVRGEALTSKVYADTINAMGYSGVTCVDPHSDVMPALIDDCAVIPNHEFISLIIKTHYNDVPEINIVSPDAGANKKVKDLLIFLHDKFDHKDFYLVKADKTRSVITGELTGFEITSNDIKDIPTIVVDDICDGGGTFLGLAKQLKKQISMDISLAVTHGIFSKGTSIITSVFHQVFTTDSFIDSMNCGKVNVMRSPVRIV